MIKGLFEFNIVSAFDREQLTCEICYKNEIVAEISQETDELMIEIFAPNQDSWWEIPLLAFQQALEDGKNYLLGNK